MDVSELISFNPAFLRGFTRTMFAAGYSEKQAAAVHHAIAIAEVREAEPRLVKRAFRTLREETMRRMLS